jgi:hypothetical protein
MSKRNREQLRATIANDLGWAFPYQGASQTICSSGRYHHQPVKRPSGRDQPFLNDRRLPAGNQSLIPNGQPNPTRADPNEVAADGSLENRLDRICSVRASADTTAASL